MKMLRTVLFVLTFFVSGLAALPSAAQNSPQRIAVTKSTIVKDSSGTVYSYDIWQKLMMTGYYYFKAEHPNDPNSEIFILRFSDAEREKRMLNNKPTESKAFKTGQEMKNFSTTDIDGKKYKLKELKGKVVVINFWFIGCPPCRAEIFELNKIVDDFKDSAGVVFLAVALDEREALKTFLKREPFKYTIIDNGRDIAKMYEVTSYPTHVVVDKLGKVYFHTVGAGASTAFWLKKSVGELLVQ